MDGTFVNARVEALGRRTFASLRFRNYRLYFASQIISFSGTWMQSIALAEGWNVGGNLREIVVFRRGEDWRLMATKLDLRGALLSKRPCPADEIWLRDGDIVVVPKMPVLVIDEFIDLVFTRGIYGVVPFQGISIGMARLTTL